MKQQFGFGLVPMSDTVKFHESQTIEYLRLADMLQEVPTLKKALRSGPIEDIVAAQVKLLNALMEAHHIASDIIMKYQMRAEFMESVESQIAENLVKMLPSISEGSTESNSTKAGHRA